MNSSYCFTHLTGRRRSAFYCRTILHSNHFSDRLSGGEGVYLTIEVDDVDTWYADLKAKGAEIRIHLRDEPWGDRHFAIQDPNGVGIDIVQYSAPEF